MYIRCVEPGVDDLLVDTDDGARALIQRAAALGANALMVPAGALPAVLSHAVTSAGLKVLDPEHGMARRPSLPKPLRSPLLRSVDAAWSGRSFTSWPELPPGAAAARLARRHRRWPSALAWVRPQPSPSKAPVPSNVVAAVRRMSGRPGQGFVAPWPEHPRDPSWAPVTVLPEPPPRRLRPGTGFASNLWLCADVAPGGDAQVTATVRWGDQCHSWAFAGSIRTAGVTTVATLPLVRPVDHPLSLELTLTTDATSGSEPTPTWRYLLADDAAGVAFWSLSIPDE